MTELIKMVIETLVNIAFRRKKGAEKISALNLMVYILFTVRLMTIAIIQVLLPLCCMNIQVSGMLRLQLPDGMY